MLLENGVIVVVFFLNHKGTEDTKKRKRKRKRKSLGDRFLGDGLPVSSK